MTRALPFQALLFDFDGVIIESVNIKTEAFRQMFADEPDVVDAILAFHLSNGGMSRYEKFKTIYRDILRRPLPDVELGQLGERFAAIVKEQIVACPFVPGALEFLQAHAAQTPLFLASGTPEAEVREILVRRGLAKYFREAYGSPQTKARVIGGVLDRYRWSPQQMLFVGDSVNDWEAAFQTNVVFWGRVMEGKPNPFPPAIPIVHDLLELEVFWQRGVGTNR